MVERLRGWTLTTGIVCPACTQGYLVWAENGFAPGYRLCNYCGRLWEAYPEGEEVHIRIAHVSDGQRERLAWEWPEEWSPEWAENGDGADKALAHTWGVHGGRGPIHTEEECTDEWEKV